MFWIRAWPVENGGGDRSETRGGAFTRNPYGASVAENRAARLWHRGAASRRRRFCYRGDYVARAVQSLCALRWGFKTRRGHDDRRAARQPGSQVGRRAARQPGNNTRSSSPRSRPQRYYYCCRNRRHRHVRGRWRERWRTDGRCSAVSFFRLPAPRRTARARHRSPVPFSAFGSQPPRSRFAFRRRTPPFVRRTAAVAAASQSPRTTCRPPPNPLDPSHSRRRRGSV